jgi:hypothetical protein
MSESSTVQILAQSQVIALCGHNAEFMNVKTGGTNSKLWALKY